MCVPTKFEFFLAGFEVIYPIFVSLGVLKSPNLPWQFDTNYIISEMMSKHNSFQKYFF
jgi:hypothetical protein